MKVETTSVAVLSHSVGSSDKGKNTRYCTYGLPNGAKLSFAQPKDDALPPRFISVTIKGVTATEFEAADK